jgi:hypothetical protein
MREIAAHAESLDNNVRGMLRAGPPIIKVARVAFTHGDEDALAYCGTERHSRRQQHLFCRHSRLPRSRLRRRRAAGEEDRSQAAALICGEI